MNESTKKTLQDLLYKLPSEGQVEEIRDEIADVIKTQEIDRFRYS